MGLGKKDVSEAVDKAKCGYYQVACTGVYKALHANSNMKDDVQNPNQYFNESRKYYKEREGYV
jgi:hypothetical protein